MKNVEPISAAPLRKLKLFPHRISSGADGNLANALAFDMLQRILGVFVENNLNIILGGAHRLEKLGNIIAHAGMAIPAAVKSYSHVGGVLLTLPHNYFVKMRPQSLSSRSYILCKKV